MDRRGQLGIEDLDIVSSGSMANMICRVCVCVSPHPLFLMNQEEALFPTNCKLWFYEKLSRVSPALWGFYRTTRVSYGHIRSSH